MVRNRSRRAVIAGVASVHLARVHGDRPAVHQQRFPTVAGQGPEGTAAFIGLVAGVVVTGIIMWAASD